jgi:hypothetical protein
MLLHSPGTVRHCTEAGAAGSVPAGAQGAVLNSAQAAVPVSPASAVQVSLRVYCSQCGTVQKHVPQVQCQQVPREQCSTGAPRVSSAGKTILLTMRHGAEAGASGPVPAGARGAVLPQCPGSSASQSCISSAAVQVSLYCSQCSTVQKQVPYVQCLKVPR